MRRVERMNLTRETMALSPEGLSVDDFAISGAGDLLAVIVSAQGAAGPESRMYLIPLVVDAVPTVVQRESAVDRLLSPSFRH